MSKLTGNQEFNGEVYIKGIGGYDGTNIASATSVTEIVGDVQKVTEDICWTNGAGLGSIKPKSRRMLVWLHLGENPTLPEPFTITEGAAGATNYKIYGAFYFSVGSKFTVDGVHIGTLISYERDPNNSHIYYITLSETLDPVNPLNGVVVRLAGVYRDADAACYADGEYSLAEGNGTAALGKCSHAEGYYTSALTDYSHAEGERTKSTGYHSHAEGYHTTASESASHAEGDWTFANEMRAHAEGYFTSALTANSHAEGSYTVTSGITSHTEGHNTKTGGGESYNTLTPGTDTAIGAYAHAEGNATIAKGNSSHAEGKKTFADVDAAHAEGYNTLARAVAAHAEGQSTLASNTNAHAEGYHTTASGKYSHAEGEYTIAKNESEHAEGHYNISNSATTTYGSSGNTQHSVGIGASDSNRKNAFEIMQNGNAYLYGVGGYDGINLLSASTLQECVNTIIVEGTVSGTGDRRTFTPSSGQMGLQDAVSAFAKGRRIILKAGVNCCFVTYCAYQNPGCVAGTNIVDGYTIVWD